MYISTYKTHEDKIQITIVWLVAGFITGHCNVMPEMCSSERHIPSSLMRNQNIYLNTT